MMMSNVPFFSNMLLETVKCTREVHGVWTAVKNMLRRPRRVPEKGTGLVRLVVGSIGDTHTGRIANTGKDKCHRLLDYQEQHRLSSQRSFKDLPDVVHPQLGVFLWDWKPRMRRSLVTRVLL